MDTKQIEYMLKIAEEKSITKAAEKLFITQSALNQQLLRLEKELGGPLFNRSRTHWGPTEIGEIYLEAAREMLQIKKRTYARINENLNRKHKTLNVAFSPGRGLDMFIHVYTKYHRLYPDITVVPHEMSVRQQQVELRHGNIDLAFETLMKHQRTDDEYIVLQEEEIFIVTQDNLGIEELPVPERGHCPTLDIQQLKDQSFILINKESTMRKPLEDALEKLDFHPEVLFETRLFTSVVDMVRAKECSCFLPAYYLRNSVMDGIKAFSFPEPIYWDVVVSYRKKTKLTKEAEAFVELVREYWG